MMRDKAATTAARLERDLRNRPIARLPSLDELARTYNTSRVTMHRAVRLLCARGILDARPGRGIIVTAAQTTGAMEPSKAAVIERYLRSLIVDMSTEHLPPLIDVARHFRTSVSAVRAGLKHLEKDGLVFLSPRCRAVVCRTAEKNANAQPPLAAEEALYQRLRSRIESGTYPFGQPLPKFEYLARTENVSVRNIARAFRRIERDGLAYRRGRTRIAGAPWSADGLGAHQRRNCVLIVQPNSATWDEFAVAPWTMPFAQAFMREMSIYGVEPVVALEQSRSTAHASPGIPAGKDAISAVVERARDRLLGILVVNRGWTMHDKKFTQKSLAWSEWLCRFGKPVVFFDHLASAHERWFDPQMRAMLTGSLGLPEVNRHFTRCYHDYFSLANQAASVLHHHGHRTIGYPTPRVPAPWMEYRRRALRISTSNLDSKMRFLDSTDCPPLFDTQESTELRTARSAFSRIERPFAHTLGETIAAMGKPSATIGALSAEQRELLEVAAYLSSFVTRPDITAIVAPNDEHARMFYRWLMMAGIRVPEDLSLLSFDDRVERAYPYTISSINFGFDSLGYTAFHILLGDVPVKVDKWKSIEAKSRINHFATIGQARRTIA